MDVFLFTVIRDMNYGTKSETFLQSMRGVD